MKILSKKLISLMLCIIFILACAAMPASADNASDCIERVSCTFNGSSQAGQE